MAQICEKCGKKIGFLSNDPMTLREDRVLCYDCADPIRDTINNLHYIELKTEFELLKNEILNNCHTLYNDIIIKDIEDIINTIYNNTRIVQTEQQTFQENYIGSYMLTTGFEFSGYKITKYLGVIGGQVVLGTGFLSEFTASWADFFGEESTKFADKIETAKNAAVKKLIKKSDDAGGNAIIGVSFDYITFSGNMIGVVANGTSVIIEKNEQ